MGQDLFSFIPEDKSLDTGLKLQKADYEVREKPF